jgi:biopolymer transport protein ExbD
MAIPGGRGGPRVALAEINVTPLVDVMLVLLIIFMVSAPLMTRGIKVELPAASSGRNLEQGSRITVSVDRRGQFHVDGVAVFDQKLVDEVRRRGGNTAGTTVFIEGDARAEYGRVLTAMDALRTAGMTQISLVTVPARSGERVRP